MSDTLVFALPFIAFMAAAKLQSQYSLKPFWPAFIAVAIPAAVSAVQQAIMYSPASLVTPRGLLFTLIPFFVKLTLAYFAFRQIKNLENSDSYLHYFVYLVVGFCIIMFGGDIISGWLLGLFSSYLQFF